MSQQPSGSPSGNEPTPTPTPSTSGTIANDDNAGGNTTTTKKTCRDIRDEHKEKGHHLDFLQKQLTKRWPRAGMYGANVSGVNCITILLRAVLANYTSPNDDVVFPPVHFELIEHAEQYCALLRHALLTFASDEDYEGALDDLARGVSSKESLADVPRKEPSFLKLLRRGDLATLIWPSFDMNMFGDVHYFNKASGSRLSYQSHPERRTTEMGKIMTSGWPGQQEKTLGGTDDLTKEVATMFDKINLTWDEFLPPVPNFDAHFGHLLITVGPPSFTDLRVYHNERPATNQQGRSRRMFPDCRYTLVAMVNCASSEGEAACIRLYGCEGTGPAAPGGFIDLGPHYDNTWRYEDLEEGTKLFCLYVKERSLEHPPEVSELIDESRLEREERNRRAFMSGFLANIPTGRSVMQARQPQVDGESPEEMFGGPWIPDSTLTSVRVPVKHKLEVSGRD